jgi:hypothetical protein
MEVLEPVGTEMGLGMARFCKEINRTGSYRSVRIGAVIKFGRHFGSGIRGFIASDPNMGPDFVNVNGVGLSADFG